VLNYVWFFLAALFEIAGCYAFWMWLRQGKSALWVIPALISLTLFALLLTRVEATYAGRAYAAYGGIYIVAHRLLRHRRDPHPVRSAVVDTLIIKP
jgi:small multidrug resistance family-3 protein